MGRGAIGVNADGDLRVSVRDRLRRGVLVLAPRQVWAGKGTGNTCVICAKTISADEVENEVIIRGSGVALKLCAHLPCLNIWRSESEMFETNGPDSPAQSA